MYSTPPTSIHAPSFPLVVVLSPKKIPSKLSLFTPMRNYFLVASAADTRTVVPGATAKSGFDLLTFATSIEV